MTKIKKPNKNLIKEIEKIEGWLTVKEGKLLHKLAKKSNGHIVEIGSWKGKSTVWLGLGSLANKDDTKIVHAVDTFKGSIEHGGDVDTYDEFIKNIRKFGLKLVVDPIKKSSERASEELFRNSVDLLFIDASHDKESVERDFQLWYPKIDIGGTIAFHDSYNFDIREVILNKIRTGKIEKIKRKGSIIYGKKTKNPEKQPILKIITDLIRFYRFEVYLTFTYFYVDLKWLFLYNDYKNEIIDVEK